MCVDCGGKLLEKSLALSSQFATTTSRKYPSTAEDHDRQAGPAQDSSYSPLTLFLDHGKRHPWSNFKEDKPETIIIMSSPRSAADESIYGHDRADGFMGRLFSSCSGDPKGSVHRAWGLTLIFLVAFFVVSMFESK